MMLSMKHAQGRSNWTANPSLSQLWLGSTLHTLAMLALNVAIFLKMIPSRLPGECHTDVAPADLPDAKSDAIKGATTTTTIETLGLSQEGLILRAHEVRVSKDEAGLTSRGSSRNHACLAIPLRQPRKSASATSPSRSATGGGKRGASGLSRWRGIASISRNATGGGGWSRLRDQTEGSLVHPRPQHAHSLTR